MKKTKIICTVGPSTDNIPLLVSMLKAGMDMARFNFSHTISPKHINSLVINAMTIHNGIRVRTQKCFFLALFNNSLYICTVFD